MTPRKPVSQAARDAAKALKAADEAAFDKARFAKAAFFGAFGAVLTMYNRGQISSTSAMEYLKGQYEEAFKDTKPAQDLLLKITNGLIDDIPLV
jgi:hypothetical protein